jgi:hypothetical protein
MGVAAVKFLVGQKKSLRRGLYFFPFGQKMILSWAKTKYLVGQTPKLIHSRYAPDCRINKVGSVFWTRGLDEQSK